MDKPVCYGKYPSKDNPGRICRGCPVAQDCKKVKPEIKKVKPEVKKNYKKPESQNSKKDYK